jgi:hypothetical protein
MIDIAAQRFFLSSLRLSCGDSISGLVTIFRPSHVAAIEGQLALPLDEGGFGIQSMRLCWAAACISALRSFDQASSDHLQYHGI